MTRDPSGVVKRVTRALDSFFHVEANSNGEYNVHSGSGNVYTVNPTAGTCSCPDGQRGAWCKHAYRVAFVTGEIPDINGVHITADNADEAVPDDEQPTEDGDTETLAARVERFEANNPGASAIEAISQLGIDPDKRERVEEVLA
jgi:hypothetical protein